MGYQHNILASVVFTLNAVIGVRRDSFRVAVELTRFISNSQMIVILTHLV